MLLPLVAEPFTAPTDRDLLPSERREFVRTHRTCVFGYRRRSDGPAMSVVYYVPTDDDELLVSTMAGRSKAIAVARDPKVSLCVLDERWPFTYLQVYADATVDTDPELVVDVMMAVGERMSGQPLGAEARPAVEAMAEQEGRVVLRCRPYATFATPPRHLQRSGEAARHTTGSRGASRGTHPTRPDPQAATGTAASTGRAGRTGWSGDLVGVLELGGNQEAEIAAARRGGWAQPRDRRATLHHHERGRVPPSQDLHEARGRVAHAARPDRAVEMTTTGCP